LFTTDESACPITFSVVQDNDDKTDLTEENQNLMSIDNDELNLNLKLYNLGDKLSFQLKAVTPFDNP